MLEEMVKKWRIVKLDLKDGFFNTALDEALLESIGKGESDPTIVITKWLPTVSIGRSQSVVLDVNQEYCQDKGIFIVRRMSGGQAVFLNEDYLVFSIVAPSKYFSKDLTELRRSFSETVVNVLVRVGIPAEFFPPDNEVVNQNNKFKTLGNTGQICRRDVICVHGSIRYEITENNFELMLKALKVNGKSIEPFRSNVRECLACVKEYSNISKEDLTNRLVEGLIEEHFNQDYYEGILTDEEIKKIGELINKRYANPLFIQDKPGYKPRGICHITLNGVPLVREVAMILPYNKPSTVEESMIG